MSKCAASFVLVHGGWHSQSCWNKVKPMLEAHSGAVVTLDLPGAGANSIAPRSLVTRPFNPTAFATEPSPTAAVTQKERTEAVLAAVKEAASLSGNVILVGHSAGGMTISDVAEEVPELLCAVVYIAGFLVPSGMSLLEMLPHEAMSSALSPGLFVGDPAVTGATRINPEATDDAYRALLRETFYGDVAEPDFAQAVTQLHCDEPADVALAPSRITTGRFGLVPRHYVRTTRDRAVPLAAQDYMIAAVDQATGGATMTHTLECSHSPFLTQPTDMSRILLDISTRARL